MRANNKVDTIPSLAKKTNWTERHEIAVVVREQPKQNDSPRLLLVRYAHGQRWAGLWDFVRVTISEGNPIKPWQNGVHTDRSILEAIEKQVTEAIGTKIAVTDHLRRIKHVVTRYKITLDCVAAVIEQSVTLKKDADPIGIRLQSLR